MRPRYAVSLAVSGVPCAFFPQRLHLVIGELDKIQRGGQRFGIGLQRRLRIGDVGGAQESHLARAVGGDRFALLGIGRDELDRALRDPDIGVALGDQRDEIAAMGEGVAIGRVDFVVAGYADLRADLGEDRADREIDFNRTRSGRDGLLHGDLGTGNEPRRIDAAEEDGHTGIGAGLDNRAIG